MRDAQLAEFVGKSIIPQIPKKYRESSIERELHLQIGLASLELTFIKLIPSYKSWFLRLLDVLASGHMVVGWSGTFPRERWYIL
jgi:hypothetical protein